jgi:hypothetical protein
MLEHRAHLEPISALPLPREPLTLALDSAGQSVKMAAYDTPLLQNYQLIIVSSEK